MVFLALKKLEDERQQKPEAYNLKRRKLTDAEQRHFAAPDFITVWSQQAAQSPSRL